MLQDSMRPNHVSKITSIILLVVIALPLLGAGCVKTSNDQFPPKPPVPGIQRSPAIDALTPSK